MNTFPTHTSDRIDAIISPIVERVRRAQKTFATYNQEQVDHIFKMAALAANNARIEMAKMAVEETAMGIVEDKVIKNHFAAEIIYNKYRNEKTCGVVDSDPSFGYQTIVEPVGLLAGIVPVTNPTSTTVFKCLLALKTRNGIIFSPHFRALKCTIRAAQIVLEAAVAAGAPEDIIAWLPESNLELAQGLMRHPSINLILATGGPGMVKSAYSSGHPSLGVGAGNTPAIIDRTADIKMAVSSIILSKTFDNGMICASEQSVIVEDEIYPGVKQEFQARGAHFLDPEETEKVRQVLLVNGRINPQVVGQSVQTIAQLAGISVGLDKKLLIGEVEHVGLGEPFSFEKLSPVLALYRSPHFQDAVTKAANLIEFAGMGHTAALYTAPGNHDHIQQFEATVKAGRILLNIPSSVGAIGDLYNFRLDPSLTLGCGSWGGNSTSSNVGIRHLLNTKSVSERRENMQWFRIPPKVYFKYGCLPVALRELKGRERAFIVTDKPLYDLGLTKEVEALLEELGIKNDVFYDVKPDPDLATIHRGLARMRTFQPDVIIALGGGSPMDAAKVMWLMYEQPDIQFEGLAVRFLDIRKRVYDLPSLGSKALLVAIPTTSGTGSEVTPFAVVTDEKTGIKYPLADYALTPTMAIIDPKLVAQMPKGLTAFGGIDALTHAIEAYVSTCATDFTNGLALEAIELLFQYLPRAYTLGAADPEARERVHYAATIAGMAFANAFLGICHSLAHKLGSMFHVPHGLANALMISYVIYYNATDCPFKQAIFPQYEYPDVKRRYGEIADRLGLGGDTDDEKLARLVAAVEDLKAQVHIPPSIREFLGDRVTEEEFYGAIAELSEQAFDDQCTGTNPRYPLIRDLGYLYSLSYEGKPPYEAAICHTPDQPLPHPEQRQTTPAASPSVLSP